MHPKRGAFFWPCLPFTVYCSPFPLNFPNKRITLRNEQISNCWTGKYRPEKVPPAHILVLVDELALPLDRLRLRGSGSDGGHNGLRSIQEQLGTTEYSRLRFGIGNNYPKGRQADFVLGKWTGEEWPVVLHKMMKSVELIEQFVAGGLASAMNLYNNVVYKL